MANYWAVGATVQGQDMSDDFIARGFWFADTPKAQDTIEGIEVGDRLAIKKMLGQGATEVHIKAVGLVTEVRPYRATFFKFFYVDWLDLRAENRRAPFAGLGGTIHRLEPSNGMFHL